MVKYGKIYPVSFGFAWGILSGLFAMVLAWLGARYNFGLPLIGVMGSVYHHYTATFVGGLWGFVWGFIHSFVFGMLVAVIYNCASKSFCPVGSCGSCCNPKCTDPKCCDPKCGK